MTFVTRDSALQMPLDVRPFHEWVLPSGVLWACFIRTSSGYLLRFPELADFIVSVNGVEIEAYPVPGVPEQTIEHLYLNQVLPLALSRQFKLVLHASAIEIMGSAVAFMGASGQGKSTLAASFSTNDYRFLTDDGLQLEKTDAGYFIKPSHPSIRLWEDSRQALIPESTQQAPAISYTPKARLLAGEQMLFCEQQRPLQSLYFLGNSEGKNISIKPVAGQEVVVELIKHSFLLDIEEREMLTHQFEQLSMLANTPMFHRLNYPREYGVLSGVREAVLSHMKAGNKRSL